MARIIDNKLLFIHIAKTGGTFVKEILSTNGVPNWETGEEHIEDHFSYDEVIKTHPQFASLTPVAIVREPISWLCSRHAWAIETEYNYKRLVQPSAQRHWMNKVWDDKLHIFIKNVAEVMPTIPSDYYSKMTKCSNGRKDFKIFEMANMQKLLNYIEDKTGYAIQKRVILNTKKTIKDSNQLELISKHDIQIINDAQYYKELIQ